MRLWSIHPSYLDAKGLVALWREGLLAKKVLQGRTKGYKNHSQLERFKKTIKPAQVLSHYLYFVYEEAEKRGYSFDKTKLSKSHFAETIQVTSGQIQFEFEHLLKKLKTRDPERYTRIKDTERIRIHPSLQRVKGEVESWEKINSMGVK